MGMTLAELTQAIRSKVDSEMEVIVAESIAEHALGFFGFSNRIIDNALELIAICSINYKTMNYLQLNPRKPRFGTVGNGEFTIGSSKQMPGNLQEGQ